MKSLSITVFAERFNSLLEASPKSATQIADDLGLSKQAISTWRTGKNTPKRPTLLTIANYFGVDVDWLSGFDVPMRPYTDAPASASRKPTDSDINAMRNALQQINALNEDGTVDSEVVSRLAGILRDFKTLFDKAED